MRNINSRLKKVNQLIELRGYDPPAGKVQNFDRSIWDKADLERYNELFDKWIRLHISRLVNPTSSSEEALEKKESRLRTDLDRLLSGRVDTPESSAYYRKIKPILKEISQAILGR